MTQIPVEVFEKVFGQVLNWRKAEGPHFTSVKVLESVRKNLLAWANNTFTESTVKELLIDVREHVRWLVARAAKEGTPLPDRHLLLDICDFVAHPVKQQGEVVDNLIVKQLASVIEELRKGNLKPVSPESLTTAMGVLLAEGCNMLRRGGLDIFDQVAPKALEHQEGMMLCLLSLLQDAVIKMEYERKKPRGSIAGVSTDRLFGRLIVHPADGYWAISALIHDAGDQAAGEQLKAIVMPVLVTPAPMPPHVLAQYAEGEFLQPPVWEMRRNGANLEAVMLRPGIGDPRTGKFL